LPLLEKVRGYHLLVVDVDLELGVEEWTNRNRKVLDVGGA